MQIQPQHLRDLVSPSALDVSHGWLSDRLGWSRKTGPRRVRRLMRTLATISEKTGSDIIRIAAEHGFTLNSQGHWQPISTRGEGK